MNTQMICSGRCSGRLREAAEVEAVPLLCPFKFRGRYVCRPAVNVAPYVVRFTSSFLHTTRLLYPQ
jgi:hypothetical protein